VLAYPSALGFAWLLREGQHRGLLGFALIWLLVAGVSLRLHAQFIVTAHIFFKAKLKTPVPVVLIADTGKLKTEAKIRIAEPEPTREPKEPGKQKEGPRITYEEVPFEDGPLRHSRYISRKIQINELNENYKQEVKMTKSDEAKLTYATLMIGKETIAYNDKSGAADDYLEKILSFYFQLKNKLVIHSSYNILKKPHGRPRMKDR
jgi:hypothetical protein